MKVLVFEGNLSPTRKITLSELAAGVAADPTALSALGEGLATSPGSVRELVAGMNALLLYLDIDPAVLVDDDGNLLTDDNGNLIIG